MGGSEHVLRAKLTLSQERNGEQLQLLHLPESFCVRDARIDCTAVFMVFAANLKKETGPVSMNFTIPMFNASRLQVITSCVRLVYEFSGP